MDLKEKLIVFARSLIAEKNKGWDFYDCDFNDIDSAVSRGKTEVKNEIGNLLLSILEEVPDKSDDCRE